MEYGLAIQIARAKTNEALEYVNESIPSQPALLMEIEELLKQAIQKMDQYLGKGQSSLRVWT